MPATPKKTHRMCDTLRCYQEAAVELEVELRQGTGRIKLCQGCGNRLESGLRQQLRDRESAAA